MGPRRRLTIREALELSPWAKWLLYGIVPWKMILHLLLVFFITLQVSQSARQASQPSLVLDSAPASPNLDRDPPIHPSPAACPPTTDNHHNAHTATGEPGQRTLRGLLPRGGSELPEPLLPDGAGHDGPRRLPLLHLHHQRHHPARPPAARHVLRGGQRVIRFGEDVLPTSCIHEMKPPIRTQPTNRPTDQNSCPRSRWTLSKSPRPPPTPTPPPPRGAAPPGWSSGNAGRRHRPARRRAAVAAPTTAAMAAPSPSPSSPSPTTRARPRRRRTWRGTRRRPGRCRWAGRSTPG